MVDIMGGTIRGTIIHGIHRGIIVDGIRHDTIEVGTPRRIITVITDIVDTMAEDIMEAITMVIMTVFIMVAYGETLRGEAPLFIVRGHLRIAEVPHREVLPAGVPVQEMYTAEVPHHEVLIGAPVQEMYIVEVRHREVLHLLHAVHLLTIGRQEVPDHHVLALSVATDARMTPEAVVQLTTVIHRLADELLLQIVIIIRMTEVLHAAGVRVPIPHLREAIVQEATLSLHVAVREAIPPRIEATGRQVVPILRQVGVAARVHLRGLLHRHPEAVHLQVAHHALQVAVVVADVVDKIA